MKASISLTLGICLVFLVSCKKNESKSTNNSATPFPENSVTLKKDGVPYNANFVWVSLLDEDLLGFETQMVYNQVNNNTYAGIIRRSIQPETYSLEDGESEYFSLFHMQDENTVFGWSHGSLTVLSNDTLLKVMHCTFDIHLFNDEIDVYPHITDGEFIIHY